MGQSPYNCSNDIEAVRKNESKYIALIYNLADSKFAPSQWEMALLCNNSWSQGQNQPWYNNDNKSIFEQLIQSNNKGNIKSSISLALQKGNPPVMDSPPKGSVR